MSVTQPIPLRVVLAIVSIALGLTLLGGCGSDSKSSRSAGPKPIALEASLVVAAGLSVAEFEAHGAAKDAVASVSSDGAFTISVFDSRPGFFFAGPRPGTAAASTVGAEAGIYFSPYLGDGLRLVRAGSGYGVATEGAAAIDATTTVISLLLMHPDLYHPAADVQNAQASWIIARLGAGWPDLSAASARYDELLVQGVGFDGDSGFTASYVAALETVRAEIPAFTSALYPPSAAPAAATATGSVSTGSVSTGTAATGTAATGTAATGTAATGTAATSTAATSTAATSTAATTTAESQSLAARGAGDALSVCGYIEGASDWYTLSSAEQVVTELDVSSESKAEVRFQAKTVVGTGLDYLFVVKPLSRGEFPSGLTDPNFVDPGAADVFASGSAIAGGTVASSSYFSYLDVVGNSMNWISDKIAGAVSLSPNGEVALPVPESGVVFYEVRMFSGGYAGGADPAVAAVVSERFSEEASVAFRQNVATAIVELMGTIPGADAVLGDDTAGKVIQEATTQAVNQLFTLFNTTGAGSMTAEDVYSVLYNIAKSAVLKYADEATKSAQKGAVRRVLSWAAWGGKRAVKFVLDVPGKVAKGGSLANRAWRLYSPDSVMELWLVGVGDEGDLMRISGTQIFSLEDPNGEWTITGVADWTLEGTEPKQDSARPEYFTVRAGQSAQFSVRFSEMAAGPAMITDYRDGATAWVERWATGAKMDTDPGQFVGYADYDVDLNATSDFPHIGTFGESSFDATFTIPPPTSDSDFPHVGVMFRFDVVGDLLRFETPVEGQPAVLVSEEKGVVLDSAGFYHEGFTIEGV